LTNIITIQKNLISSIQANSFLWDDDPEVRADPEYTGFRKIVNNRVFPSPSKSSYPILAVDIGKTITVEMSSGDCAPVEFELLLQIYTLAGSTDTAIADAREKIVLQMYEILETNNLSPMEDIVHFEDIIGSERVHCVGAVVRK